MATEAWIDAAVSLARESQRPAEGLGRAVAPKPIASPIPLVVGWCIGAAPTPSRGSIRASRFAAGTALVLQARAWPRRLATCLVARTTVAAADDVAGTEEVLGTMAGVALPKRCCGAVAAVARRHVPAWSRLVAGLILGPRQVFLVAIAAAVPGVAGLVAVGRPVTPVLAVVGTSGRPRRDV